LQVPREVSTLWKQVVRWDLRRHLKGGTDGKCTRSQSTSDRSEEGRRRSARVLVPKLLEARLEGGGLRNTSMR